MCRTIPCVAVLSALALSSMAIGRLAAHEFSFVGGAARGTQVRTDNAPKRPDSACQQLEGAVVVREGRLSIHAADYSLATLLGEVARCTPRLAISVAPEIESDSISIEFTNAPIDSGLRRIVGAYDAFFYYAGAPSSPVLEKLWVFPRGDGRALAPLDTAIWASDADVEKRLTDRDPDVRLRALEAHLERRGEAALDAVLTALADEDLVQRAQVLDLAFGGGLQIPSDRLMALVVSDPSPLIRLQALQNAPEGSELAGLAEAAQNDPDPHVQAEAQAILARVATAAAGTMKRPVPQP